MNCCRRLKKYDEAHLSIYGVMAGMGVMGRKFDPVGISCPKDFLDRHKNFLKIEDLLSFSDRHGDFRFIPGEKRGLFFLFVYKKIDSI